MKQTQNHNRSIATGDKSTHSAKSNRLHALRIIAAQDPNEGKRKWAERKIIEILESK